MWLGFFTAIWALFVFFLRETREPGTFYSMALFLLFLPVNVTGYFGGGLTFGTESLLPPSFG